MKLTKLIILGAALIFGLFSLTGCSSSPSPQMMNKLQFALDGISTLTISYDEENITFYESENEFLVCAVHGVYLGGASPLWRYNPTNH
ncbi:MAG: hypothetical protein LBV19_10640 [Streptococcaceae bacterium]|jgi:uncharacterized protein YcfL|nr:hypothetical protein [Streptococcaceae bacterium]